MTLKNINYVSNKGYIECLTGAQLAWLAKDLSYVPKDHLVILNMHAAGWNKVFARGNVRNANRLAEVLKGHNVHVFCGHTHFMQNVEVSPTLYQHNIGAACGTWWESQINRCGAPNGYMIVEIDGTDLKWHYKGSRRSLSYQFKVYGKGEFRSQSSFIVANIWDWDSKCKAVWYQDGKLMGDMEQFTDVDHDFAIDDSYVRTLSPTGHLFRAMPADGAKEVRIVFTNRFGESYTQSVKL